MHNNPINLRLSKYLSYYLSYSSSQSDLGDEVVFGEAAVTLYSEMLSAIYNYDFNHVQLYTAFPTRGSGTYNSNSFAFTLINEFLPDLSYTNPPRAPGWGITIPNL